MNKISQREARRLRRRVEELEAVERRRRYTYVKDYPGGVNIAQLAYGSERDFLPAVVINSRKLGHAVIVINDGATLLFYALPHKDLP